MKKILLSLSIVLTAYTAQAQCTPDQSITTPGIYPGALPDACEGAPYSEALTIALQKNIVIFGFTVNVDSAIVTSIDNLPTGLSYECHNSTCTIIAGTGNVTLSCLSIIGTPTSSGTNNMTVNYTAYSGGSSVPSTYDVSVTIKAVSDAVCLASIYGTSNKQNKLTVYPNPVSGESLNFSTDLHNISITDQLGNTRITLAEGNSVDVSTLPKGIYFLKADEGIQKIIIE